jgi:TetR/AcrR family transcriptional regulator, regulator of biofilm formation and stress response
MADDDLLVPQAALSDPAPGPMPSGGTGEASSLSRAPKVGARSRRFDPRRKERIVDAALVVLAEHGIAGTSLRRVAERADVPLGSLTYHFAGTNDLFAFAFRKFIGEQLARLENRLIGAPNAQDAWLRLLEMIHDDSGGRARRLSLAKEFQALAVREQQFRGLAQEWLEGSIIILQRHFDPATARIIEILLEGLSFRGHVASLEAYESLCGAALRRLSTPD